jgi:hypothetical protein
MPKHRIDSQHCDGELRPGITLRSLTQSQSKERGHSKVPVNTGGTDNLSDRPLGWSELAVRVHDKIPSDAVAALRSWPRQNRAKRKY